MPVSITIDDCGKAQIDAMLPVLDAYDVKATWFISGNRWKNESDKSLAHYVATLQGAGHEIGNHSLSHMDMSKLGANKLEIEIRSMHDKLMYQSSEEIKSFCFPGFHYSQMAIDVLEKMGYSSARIGIKGLTPEQMEDGAFGPYVEDSLSSPMMIQCSGVFGKTFGYKQLVNSLEASCGRTSVLCFHGVYTSEPSCALDIHIDEFVKCAYYISQYPCIHFAQIPS